MHCSDRKEDKIMVGKQERRYQRMITVVLALISLIMVIPLVLLVVASFTSNNEIVLHGYSFFPKELSLEAYRYIWNERAQVFHAYGITILVTAIGTTIGVMMTLLYAYVLAHEKFPGKHFLHFICFSRCCLMVDWYRPILCIPATCT